MSRSSRGRVRRVGGVLASVGAMDAMILFDRFQSSKYLPLEKSVDKSNGELDGRAYESLPHCF